MSQHDDIQLYARGVEVTDAKMEEVLTEMRHRLNDLHGRALELHDPLLMAMSANLMIVERAVQSAKASQDEVLREHRSELELITARWQRDADAIGVRIASHILNVTAQEARQGAQRACNDLAVRVEGALERHSRQMWRTLISGAAAAAFVHLGVWFLTRLL